MSLESIRDGILAYDEAQVKERVAGALATGLPAADILAGGLIDAMDEVGRRFSEGEIFVPEMLLAAQVMKAGLNVLAPDLKATTAKSQGTVVIGTVKGDLHDIGKNLVAMMLEGGGFTVIDLGVDVDAATFVAAAREHHADIIALSALLTTTMPAMRETVASLSDAGLTRTIVGGAPITRAFAEQIGAAGFSEDAPGAVRVARNLLEPESLEKV